MVSGKRKERPEPEPEPLPPPFVLTPTSDDCSFLVSECTANGILVELLTRDVIHVLLVNEWENAVYDEYVRPLERVVDFRTEISGIRPKDLWKAKSFWAAQKKVAELIKGRILVGHSLSNDFKALLLSHPKKDIRDTSEYQPFLREGRRRALRDLAAHILGVKIQIKEHCSISKISYKYYPRGGDFHNIARTQDYEGRSQKDN
ncbi:Small RNA degrading nuclease 2 [Acorus calamus]|uniref:RNA exonuclease 4 n=1 Tax=Acorus calamus TaxID=4465 RepID=A0AAV9DPC2_ACOCL|nr:Small RNA degrading nuclease 2 [Acorus calamus]